MIELPGELERGLVDCAIAVSLALAVLVLAAANIVRQRAKRIQGAFPLILSAILCGAGSVFCLMAVTGVIPITESRLIR